MTSPVPMASGRDADVYALDVHRVLRRYRDGVDATAEAAVMGYLGALGYPVPHVHSVDHADMVLERLHGPTMLQALTTGQLDPHAGARQLAGLQTRLHALPPRTSTDPRSRVLHGDLHPDNVVLTARGPVVIDWRNTTEGPPELDVALSAVILAQTAVGDAGDLAGLARAFLTAFLTHSGPLAMLAEATSTRRGDPNLSEAEINRLDQAASLIEVLAKDS
ncbi:serine/threonine protein kinase [Saccharothrix sp. NRRL B-16348]|uniref:phosphotransferase n=1 Tax=Saccharothrix sp. NRRL B-16348 TaxID=1415542 RepID=UPI0006AFEE27|nr:phosphotransferase [Saccharothrix sp. NRRL B-16348]KOX19908.1 serine/threonine protein kinase [Saccharothrix sp. NRRL B-16348]